ncbi:MAG: AzlD domain-containing protein [Halolamina sp.]
MNAWVAIAAIGVGTFAIRASFIYLYEYLDLPPLAERALELVPAAVLSALVAPAVFVRDDGSVAVADPRVGAAVVAAAVAWYSDDILLTIVGGLAALLALRAAV